MRLAFIGSRTSINLCGKAVPGAEDRQRKIPGFDQDLFSRSHVLCIGAGGITSQIAPTLVRKGIGRITLLDDDVVEPSNLNRQRFYIDVGEIYVTFDANTYELHFPNGSFWTMGCVSASSEPDSGVMYPTLMEDTNGNQILIRYNAASGANWTNSSSRISEIEDVRAINNGGGDYQTYVFTYSSTLYGGIPHLLSIANTIGTSEAYTFAYPSSQTLAAPFSPYTSLGGVQILGSVTTQGINTATQFTYVANSNGTTTGELLDATLPYGGYLSYNYDTVTYTSGVSYREVASRVLSKDGTSGSATTYAFSHESTPGAYVRQYTIIDDPGGVGEKYWAFGQSGITQGLLTTYQGRSRPGPVALQESDLTWSQDSAGNSYIGTAVQKMDPGKSYEQDKRTDQALDTHGNVTQTLLYNFGNTTTPALTYNYTYLSSSSYTNLYIFNRLTQATVTSGNNVTTLVSNSYDQGSLSYPNGLSGFSGGNTPREIDPSYTNSGGPTTRGNLTTSTTPDSSKTTTYDYTGNPISVTTNAVQMNVTNTTTNNYAAPMVLSAGSLSQTIAYNPSMTPQSSTGQNGDTTTMTYDIYGRPTGATSPYGATSTITYNNAPYSSTNQATSKATIDGRWTQNMLDGLGRTVLTQSGDASGANTQAESVYGSCGCSPFGKLIQQAMPHAPGGTPAYTTYTYDGIGRTLSVQAPDGASTTSYIYAGNQVQVTDPAGKLKIFTMDAFGNVVTVYEPDPAHPTTAYYITNYGYDVLNNLTQVSMTRPTGTQTRSFTYNGHQILTATNPENGTVTYTYNTQNKVSKLVDQKGQAVVYSYDSQARLTEIQRYPQGTSGSEDACQRETYSYDTNPYNSTFSQNASGRLTAVQYYGGYNNGSTNCNTMFTEMYNYMKPSAIVAKQLQVTRNSSTAVLEADYTYDTEGRMITVHILPLPCPRRLGHRR